MRNKSSKIFFIFYVGCFFLPIMRYSYGAINAGIIDAPFIAGDCPAGSVNMIADEGLICVSSPEADATGIMLVGPGASYEPGYLLGFSYLGVFDNAYAPFSGVYRDRIYICQANSAGLCLISKSSDHIDGANSFSLDSSRPIGQQYPNAGGAATAKKIDYSYSYCQVLIDKNGKEWVSTDKTSCSDGSILPDHPSVCSINGGADLDINFGQIDRAGIISSPEAGNSGNIKKTISVDCSGDANINVKTQFKYASMAFNNNQFVATSNSNLGVAIIYKGKLVNPDIASEDEYEIGTTSIDLEFAAVRDPNVATKAIATGDFTSSAVMVMTLQ